MERVNALPIYLKNKDGTDGRRARFSYQQYTTFVFLTYCFSIFAVFLVSFDGSVLTIVLFILRYLIFSPLFIYRLQLLKTGVTQIGLPDINAG
jgi:hypothetical protein